jgi:hypothetical protein
MKFKVGDFVSPKSNPYHRGKIVKIEGDKIFADMTASLVMLKKIGIREYSSESLVKVE